MLPGSPDPVRRVLETWVASMEAMLRATFEAQQAMLEAGLAVAEATLGGQAGALRQWVETARSAQQAAFEGFLTSARAAWSAPPPSGTSPAELGETAEPRVEAYCLRCRMRRPSVVEGQNTKIKLIKRMMYGPGRFDLLRKRVLLAS